MDAVRVSGKRPTEDEAIILRGLRKEIQPIFPGRTARKSHSNEIEIRKNNLHRMRKKGIK